MDLQNDTRGPGTAFICLYVCLQFHTRNHSKHTQTNNRIATAKHAFSFPYPPATHPIGFLYSLLSICYLCTAVHTRSLWFGQLAQESDEKTCWYECLDNLEDAEKKKWQYSLLVHYNFTPLLQAR